MAALASQGLLAAHALDCREPRRDGPSLARAIAGGSSVFGLPWPLAIAAGSSGGTNQVRGTNHFALQRLRERRPTPAFSGATNGIEKPIRTVLRGLRCNALFGHCQAITFSLTSPTHPPFSFRYSIVILPPKPTSLVCFPLAWTTSRTTSACSPFTSMFLNRR